MSDMTPRSAQAHAFITPKPGMVTAIGVMTLINGILNLLWGLGVTASIVLGTLGLGLLCAPVTILPSILGIFEIVFGARLLAASPLGLRPSRAIAVLEICAIVAGNFVSLVVGILVLVFYADASVKDYFAHLSASPGTPSAG